MMRKGELASPPKYVLFFSRVKKETLDCLDLRLVISSLSCYVNLSLVFLQGPKGERGPAGQSHTVTLGQDVSGSGTLQKNCLHALL